MNHLCETPPTLEKCVSRKKLILHGSLFFLKIKSNSKNKCLCMCYFPHQPFKQLNFKLKKSNNFYNEQIFSHSKFFLSYLSIYLKISPFRQLAHSTCWNNFLKHYSRRKIKSSNYTVAYIIPLQNKNKSLLGSNTIRHCIFTYACKQTLHNFFTHYVYNLLQLRVNFLIYVLTFLNSFAKECTQRLNETEANAIILNKQFHLPLLCFCYLMMSMF